jgi:hypothetical protein
MGEYVTVFREVWLEGADWINSVQDRDQRQAPGIW